MESTPGDSRDRDELHPFLGKIPVADPVARSENNEPSSPPSVCEERNRRDRRTSASHRTFNEPILIKAFLSKTTLVGSVTSHRQLEERTQLFRQPFQSRQMRGHLPLQVVPVSNRTTANAVRFQPRFSGPRRESSDTPAPTTASPDWGSAHRPHTAAAGDSSPTGPRGDPPRRCSTECQTAWQ
jgi:hypothetical protein